MPRKVTLKSQMLKHSRSVLRTVFEQQDDETLDGITRLVLCAALPDVVRLLDANTEGFTIAANANEKAEQWGTATIDRIKATNTQALSRLLDKLTKELMNDDHIYNEDGSLAVAVQPVQA